MFHVELVKLAELQIEQGDLDKAKQTLTQALKYNPNYPWANLRMASLLLKDNEIKGAEQHLENTIKANIENDGNFRDAVIVLQGDVARFKGEYQKAIHYYDRVLSSSTNLQILKSALQKQLQILKSVYYHDTENLIGKYIQINEEITIFFITLFYQICKKYKLQKYITLINDKYTYLSDELLSYRVNNLIISGGFSQAYEIISAIDISLPDKKYQCMVLYAEINEFLGNTLLSIECLEQALAIQENISLRLKKILMLAEFEFDTATEKLRILLSHNLTEFKTEDFQLLLNNIKYKGSQLFEYVLEKYDITYNNSQGEDALPIFGIEYRAILVIQKYLTGISQNRLDINRVFQFLENVSLNSLLKREILIQIYNGRYNIPLEHFSFIDQLNEYISKSDIYYKQLILSRLNYSNQIDFNNLFIVVLNSTNIGDTILYLYSLFELCSLSEKKVILITCFENQDTINLVKGDWISSIIYLVRQDITSRYCPYQEIRPVLPGSITYLSQGGKDRLKVSTKDGVWWGNFLNFRRLNVVDYYLRKYHESHNSLCPPQSIHYSFSQIIKNNIASLSSEETKDEKIAVIAPIANSLGYYYNLSEMNYLWVSIIDCLIAAGFKVRVLKSNKESCKETDDLVQSIAKHCNNHHNVAELDLNIIDFVKYVESVDCFIGVRSGICDLINFVDNKHQKKLCIYPPKVNYCCGLANWKHSNFIEFHLPENYKIQIKKTTKEIYALLWGIY